MTPAIPETYMAKAMAFIQAHPGRDIGSMVALALMEAGQGAQVPRIGLTPQQLAAVQFIAAYEDQHGFPPTFDEIREHLGLASKSGVHRLVEGLVQRGAVVRLRNRWSSISAVRRAAQMSDVNVSIVPFERNHKPNTDGDIKSLVQRLVAVEDKFDAEQKLKSLIFAEARVAGVDIGALKSVVRVCRYLPQSRADGMPGLSNTVKQYLDLVNTRDVSSAHKNSEN